MKEIGVLFGGYSSEYKVSVLSGEFVYQNIKDNPDWNVYKICISRDKNFVEYRDREFDLNLNNFTFIIDNKTINLDAVFNIIHGDPGENGILANILEKNNIPQTACDSYVSKLTFNKKKYLEFTRNLNIPSSYQILIKKNDRIDIKKISNKINIPCIVKPNNGGSSIGLSKVNNSDKLFDKIKIAFKEGDEVLIENFLSGQEVSVGVIEKENERIILPITEIISDNEVFDFNAKYKGESQEITPGNISKESKDLIHEYINIIYDNIKLKGITRSEFIIVDNNPHLLETNTIPGFTKESIIPQQIEAFGLSVKDVLYDQIKSIL
tara:strand:+ start:6551 stop:7519 length:969 start_codon:yes stop_codon:yes gene_type:complete